MASSSREEGGSTAFSSWVKEQGGTDEFISILREFGFNSRLSLSNLKLNQPDGEELLERFNCGQRCLLRGLVDLAGSTVSSNSYSGCIRQVEKVKKKTELPAMRSKINQLFNFNSKSKDSPAGSSSSAKHNMCDSDDEFLPKPSFRPTPPSKRHKSGKGKGKEPMGKPLHMKKVSGTRQNFNEIHSC